LPKKRVAGVILAGGQATRMGGGDKCLLDLGDGRVLLDEIMARLAPQVECLALNANGDPVRFGRYGLPVLPDSMDDAGPLAGVLAAMDWAQAQDCSAVVTVAGDTPFFPTDLVARLMEAGEGHKVAIAATDRVHPVFALWDIALIDTLTKALAQGMRRVAEFASLHGTVTVRFPQVGALDPFFNINTKADLELVRQTLAHKGLI
jgi:molybdenum cofactor guanylyltransferase